MRFDDRLPADSYRVLRFLIGIAGATFVVRTFAHGWLEQLYVEPQVFFSYPGLEFLRPLPQPLLELQFIVMAVAALCFAFGFRVRLCIAIFLVNFAWVELIDQTTYVNHYYFLGLMCALLFVVEPYCRSVPGLAGTTVERWALWLLRAQVGMVYSFAGVAKLDTTWLFQGQPLRTWLYQHSDLIVVGPLLALPATALLMSWAGALFDLTVVGFLLWPRTRACAFAAVVVFHVATACLFPSLGLFPWLMIGSVTIFFRPDWPRLLLSPLLARPSGRSFRSSGTCEGSVPASGSIPEMAVSFRNSVTVTMVVLAMVVQSGLPFRHLLLPGDVDWTEAGYRFSWRVMRNEKAGFVRYQVCDREATLDCVRVAPSSFLTPLQVERMAHQPSMIVFAARLLADRHLERTGRPAAVRADAWVSMNGRTARRLIDPNCDLTRTKPARAILARGVAAEKGACGSADALAGGQLSSSLAAVTPGMTKRRTSPVE